MELLLFVFLPQRAQRSTEAKLRFEQRVQYGKVKPCNHKGHEGTQRGLQKWSPFYMYFHHRGHRGEQRHNCARLRAMYSVREGKNPFNHKGHEGTQRKKEPNFLADSFTCVLTTEGTAEHQKGPIPGM
jgi:hypothetical protein